MNRMIADKETERAQWVIFFAFGGFVGNFIFSLAGHAQNEFLHRTEWIPVISSAVAVGFLIVPLSMKAERGCLSLCGLILLVQMAIGALGFGVQALAGWNKTGEKLFQRIVHGPPMFAPTLFCDLAGLALIGLWVLGRKHHAKAA
jgi:hypothetical protein